MTLRNPNANESVEDYDKLQTAQINANTTEIGTIKQSILTILSKLNLISDWVIESGSNSNGSYEKWNSGKLVQWGSAYTGNQTLALLVSPMYWKAAVPLENFPIPFIGSLPIVDFTPKRRSNAGWGTLVSGSSSLTNIGSFDIFGTNANHAGFDYDWKAIGRWK